MRKLFLLLLLTIGLANIASAQNGYVTVTATVKDPTGALYVNSQVGASFIDPGTSGKLPLLYGSTFQTSYTGYGTDSFAHFSMSVADNQQIGSSSGATGTSWRFTILYQDRATSFTYQTPIDCIDNIPVTCNSGVMDISIPLQAVAALLPVTGSGSFASINVVASPTPVFNSNGNTVFNYTLNQNVTASTFITSSPVGKATIFQFNICQNVVGGFTMNWPTNVTLPSNYTFSTTPNSCSPVAFVYNPALANWTPWQGLGSGGGGGGGGVPVGAIGTIEKVGNIAGTFAASNCLESGTTLNCTDDPHFRGPNLGVDVTVSPFNARAVSTSFIPLTTGTITGGTNALVIASNSPPFLVNDGVALVGAGATNCGTPPSAPTVTPSLASFMTGTGHAVAGAAGSTPYSYVVVAVSQGGCYTAASAIGSTATGNATLGAANIPITSCVNISGTVTCTVGSTTGLATGMWVRIGGTLDDGEFGGRHNITVLNGTQFTYLSNVSSIYPMFSTTTTGGTLYFWRENHIVLSALPAGTNLYKYAVYRCTGASCALPANAANYSLVYISYPANLPFIDAAYNTWDDYGSISTVNSSSTPWFIPTTPPATNVNDMLVTTVTGIAGTAFTLAANATNTVGATSCNGGACSLRFDDAPAITACEAASNTASAGGGGACHVPPQLETGAAGVLCYVTSSYLVVNSILNVGGAVCNGETVELSGARGALLGAYEDTIHSSTPGFGIQTLLQWTCFGANPCIWRKGPPIKNLLITTSGPSETLVFDNSTSPTLTENVQFNVPDGMGIADLAYNARFGGNYNNTSWTSGQAQVIGAVDTPLYRNINSFQTTFNNISGSLRGLNFECAPNAPPTGADDCAFYITVRQGGNTWQGPITPLVTVNASSGGRFGWIYLEHMIQDSGAEPIFVASGGVKATVIINGTNQPGKDPAAPLGGGQPIISGNPITGGVSVLTDSPLTSQVIGMNHDLMQCPQPATDFANYRGCVLPSLNLATASYSGNHTLNASEGIVFETGSGTTITANSALAGQVWDVFNTSSGTVTLAISSGVLSCTGAVGSCTIPANQGAHVACNGTNCSALGLGGGGGGASPGGTTDALQYNGGGSNFGGVNSPTANGNYNVHYRVTTSAAVPPSIDPSGIPINVQTGTTYTIGTANTDFDRGYVITANNAGAQTYTFVNPSTIGYGFNHYFVIKNIGTGTVTATASGFTINGAASLLIPPNWTVFFWSDGVNYFASRLPDFTAFPNCVGAGNALQFTTATGVLSCGASSAGVTSITGDGIVISNSASTGAVTLTLANAAAHKFLMNNTAGSAAPGYQSPGKADLLGTIVYNDQANTYGAFLQDLSAGTWKIPTAAGFTAGATSMFGYDSTNKNWHIYDNNADAIGCAFASTPSTNNLVLTSVVSSNLLCTGTTVLPNGVTATTQAAKDNSTKVATTAYVDAPTGLTAGTSVTLTAPRQYFVCTGTCTITVPVPAAGYEFCVMNDDNVATVITLSALGSSARYENTARTAYGTAGTGTFISGGAVGDKVCLLGRDATHYLTATFNGAWTAN